MFDTGKKLKILAIGAHGDDIELACGGTLAKAIEHNHEVKMVLVTGNGSSDHNDVTIRTDGIAEQEAKAAAKVLGVSKLHILGYQDTCVPYSADLVAKLDEIISEFKPDIIFTHFENDLNIEKLKR